MGYPDGLFGERAGDPNLRNIKLERVSKNFPKSYKVREEGGWEGLWKET